MLVYVLALTFALAVAVGEYATGPKITLAVFSLMPAALLTWNRGGKAGVAVSAVSTLVVFIANLLASPEPGFAPYWNGVVQLSVLLFVVWILATLREAVQDQQAQLDREGVVTDDLRKLNDLKDTLLHAVSHDLKGPLAAILGATQTLRREAQLALSAEEMESLYGMIEQSGRKMDRLIDDLFDLDRLDRGQLLPDRAATDVGALVRRLARDALVLGGHPVRVEADPGLVFLDEAKVERIVENLLRNAAKHTPPATPVRVRVTSRADGIELMVEDEGPGIPAELREEIFETFRRGPSAGGEGVGLGLSLVRRFAELHGGTAHAEDRVGGGARFVVWLPGEIAGSPAAEGEGRLRVV